MCQHLRVEGRNLRVATALVGTAVAVVGEGVALSAGRPANAALLDLAIGLAYLYGGLAIWDHDPENAIGRWMSLVGLTWFIGSFAGSSIPAVAQLALAFGDTSTIALFAVILAYPSGRLETRLHRVAVGVLAVGATGLNILFSTDLPLTLDKSAGLYGGLALAVMTSAVILRRWIVAPRRDRQELLPVLVAGTVFLVALISNLVRRIANVPEDTGALLVAAQALAPAAIPVALLIGFYRQSERRLRAVVEAIPDTMLRFARDGRFLGSSGTRLAQGADFGDEEAQQLFERLFAEAGAATLATADRALETGELQTLDVSLDLTMGRREFEARVAPSGPDEVTAIVRDFTEQRETDAELRRSRARIVEATDAERRRLERDLHDGAQQRLVSLSLALRVLRSRLADPDVAGAEAMAAADDAAREASLAIRELRELARGIHPAILTEAGLGPAITSLAARSTVPAVVGALPDRRLPVAVEATAYFVVSEALTNTAKYAAATRSSITADEDGAVLRLEVGDDGVGGADRSRGTGIRGLQDRVQALGGRLIVESPPGHGTRIVAEIPIG